MSLLIIGLRTYRNFPICIGYNREENPKRKTSMPKLTEDKKSVIAGLDASSEGTWVGSNQHNLVVALVNRNEKPLAAQKKSRGQLVSQALELEHPDKVLAFLKKSAKESRPFNLFFGNMNVAYSAQWDGKKLTAKKLDNGYYVILPEGINPKKDPFVKHVVEKMEHNPESEYIQEVYLDEWRDIFFRLIQLCREHEESKNNPEEKKKKAVGKKKGTRTISSSLFVLANRGVQFGYLWHLTGSPLTGTYRDFSKHLRKIESTK